jgi:hypothetical protein
MTDDSMARIALLPAKTDDADFLQSVAERTLQRLMEFEVEGLCGAARHDRSGYRSRALDTRLAALSSGSQAPPGVPRQLRRAMDRAVDEVSSLPSASLACVARDFGRIIQRAINLAGTAPRPMLSIFCAKVVSPFRGHPHAARNAV